MNSYYTDILFKGNPTKFRALCEKHFATENPDWEKQVFANVEAFIFDFLKQKINVHSVKARVQIGTGMPTWVISYER